MNNIRFLFLALASIAAIGLTALLTASLLVVLAGVVAASAIARVLMSPMRRAPVCARSRKEQPRIWNDGRGPIIDQ